jgi:hypothetical protein
MAASSTTTVEPAGRSWRSCGGAVEAVLDQHLVHGVGGQAGVDGQDLGRRSGRGHPEHRTAAGPELLDGGGDSPSLLVNHAGGNGS